MSRVSSWRSAFALTLLAACAAPTPRRFEFEEPAMGTKFHLALYAESSDAAARAARAAFGRVHELDATMSDYRDDSELSRLSFRTDAGAPTEWSPLGDDLWNVLVRAQEFAQASDGAFDVTVGPLSALWRRARRQGELPNQERISAALASVGWRKLELDPRAHAARLLAPGMRLDLGGIAKGYAVDQALAVLAQSGIERALVVGGGEVGASGAPPEKNGWRVQIVPFGDASATVTIELAHGAVSTSGDAYQALVLDGQRYSHVVDPRDGHALTSRVAASALARDGTTADALATTLCVLGPERGLAWVQSLGGAEVRIVREAPAGIETRSTPGFERRILRAAPPGAPSSSTSP